MCLVTSSSTTPARRRKFYNEDYDKEHHDSTSNSHCVDMKEQTAKSNHQYSAKNIYSSLLLRLSSKFSLCSLRYVLNCCTSTTTRTTVENNQQRRRPRQTSKIMLYIFTIGGCFILYKLTYTEIVFYHDNEPRRLMFSGTNNLSSSSSSSPHDYECIPSQSEQFVSEYDYAKTMNNKEREKWQKPKICITTMSDSSLNRTSVYKEATNLLRIRNFGKMLEYTYPNKQQYANIHNYQLYDASNLIDTSRPPSWSKIIAVQSAFRKGCDWVFWTDADSLIMNTTTKIEQFIPASSSTSSIQYDLIITLDPLTVNAGMFIIRNSIWSKEFLQRWWNMSSYVLPPGLTKSGDNDALKAFIHTNMLPSERDRHILLLNQCSFNSYLLKFRLSSLSYTSCSRHNDNKSNNNSRNNNNNNNNIMIKMEEERKRLHGAYRKGDFILHTAGINNKAAIIRDYLKVSETLEQVEVARKTHN